MNQLVNCAHSANFGGLSFGSIIRTEITCKDGHQAALLTLMTDPEMWESAVMGVNTGLRAGDMAEMWHNQVYTIINGTLYPFGTYATTSANDIPSASRLIEELRNKVAELKAEVADYYRTLDGLKAYNTKVTNDLIAAHTKIGALRYHLEANGIKVPEHLK